MSTLPLDGIRVLAVENFMAGPVASMWLADAGAEVVKIERPGSGDQARSLAPYKELDGQRYSIAFNRANRNKQSVTLDLKTPEGHDIFLQLVAEADVLLENLNPTAMTGLGFGYEDMKAVNPRLIYASVSGFGRDDHLPSPYGNRAAFDIVGQAMSGLMLRPAGAEVEPVYLGFPLADLYAASLAVTGIYQALFARERTGTGAHIDISLVDASILLNELGIALYSATGQMPSPGLHALTAPFGAYCVADGDIVIGVLGEPVWQRFAVAVDMPELVERPEFADGLLRHCNHKLLLEAVQPWLSAHSVEEAIAQFERHDVPAAPLLNIDGVIQSPHTIARQMVVDVEDPAWGTLKIAGNPIKSTMAAEMPVKPPPLLGADTQHVLNEWIGMDRQRIDALRSKGIL